MRIWDTDFGRAFPYDSFAPSQIAMPDRSFVTRDITLGELRLTMLRIRNCSDQTWRKAGDHIGTS
eukprot:12856339-Prorocentrum_lima.AAC.1